MDPLTPRQFMDTLLSNACPSDSGGNWPHPTAAQPANFRIELHCVYYDVVAYKYLGAWVVESMAPHDS